MKFLASMRPRQRLLILGGVLLVITVALLGPLIAQAQIPGATTIGNWLAQLTFWIIRMLANLLVVIINIMVAVAQYNTFLGSPAVVKGWVIVRDISNMFFIVVLLIIAFGTILRLENYRYNRLLARLIVMAILVNFSKFIAGFFIDFAQVIMLTFVNAWRDAAAGNITEALGLKDIISISGSGFLPGENEDVGAVLTAMLLGLFLVVIAVIVMAIIALVLILRILALWFLIVLSPLAFLLRTYPSTEKYASRWWQEFGKYVVTGPVVAFLMWLSLAIMATPNQFSQDVFVKTAERGGVITGIGSTSGTAAEISAAITEIGKSDKLLSYIMGIMLLVGTLVITKELGVAGGQLAGQWAEKIKGFGTRAAAVGGAFAVGGPLAAGAVAFGKQGIQLAKTGVKKGAGFVGRRLDEMNIRAQKGQGPLAGLYKRVLPTGLRERLKERQVSFRSSMIKKAYEEYRKRREEGLYRGTRGSMVDYFNQVMSRGKFRTDFAYIDRKSGLAALMSEVKAGGTRKEQLVARLKTFIEFQRDASGKVVGAKIHEGEEGRVEAILKLLTPNHDINEVIKDREIGQFMETLIPADEAARNPGAAHAFTPSNVARLLRTWFGEREAGELGLEIGELGFANTDMPLYSMATVDERGRPRLISEEDHARVKTRQIFGTEGMREYAQLRRYNPEEHGGVAWRDFAEERERQIKAIKEDTTLTPEDRASRIRPIEQELYSYRDQIDDEIADERASWAAGYNAKRENREIARRMRRQDFAPEVGFGPGNMYFRRALGAIGEQLIRDVLSATTDYRFANAETKDMFQRRVDVIKAFADTGTTNPEERQAARRRYRELTGEEAPLKEVNEEQRRGIYRMIAMVLGASDVDAGNVVAKGKKIEDISTSLDEVIGKYHYNGAYGKFELEKNRLIEENRPFLDSATTTEEQLKQRLKEIEQQAARNAGIDFIPTLGTPVGLVGKEPTPSPTTTPTPTPRPTAPAIAPTPAPTPSVPTPAAAPEGATPSRIVVPPAARFEMEEGGPRRIPTGATEAEALFAAITSLEETVRNLDRSVTTFGEFSSKADQALKSLERSGHSRASELRSRHNEIMSGKSRGGLIETDYDKRRTAEYLRDLIQVVRDQRKQGGGGRPEPEPPRRGPGGEAL